MTDKIRAMVSCQNLYCAEEVSYNLDMVRLFKGQPICEHCYVEDGYGMVEKEEDGKTIMHQDDWHELPDISLENLCA